MLYFRRFVCIMIFHNMLVCVIFFKYNSFGFWMFLKFHFRLKMVQSIIHCKVLSCCDYNNFIHEIHEIRLIQKLKSLKIIIILSMTQLIIVIWFSIQRNLEWNKYLFENFYSIVNFFFFVRLQAYSSDYI